MNKVIQEALELLKTARERLSEYYVHAVLRSMAERVAAGIITAAAVAIFVDPAGSAWALAALAIAGGLFHMAARPPEGGEQ